MIENNPYNYTICELEDYGRYYSIEKLEENEKIKKLPYSIKILLECMIRNCDNYEIKKEDVLNIINWKENSKKKNIEISFKPSRVILQDFTGVPALVDLASMRDKIKKFKKNIQLINPLVPVDLIVDHSIQVDFSRTKEALEKNEEMEFRRNAERFAFLKWGAKAFNNMLIVPPGSGIIHQVNLEYLARVVFEKDGFIYPDSVVGTDSHTTMIDGLGVVGWGVGGIEAEAVLLGQPISMLLPEVIGFKLHNKLNEKTTATDLVLTVTSILRKKNVVGKFVEFFGDGCATLSLADRATIANMSPEYGATMGFFPVDERTFEYLKQTGRTDEKISLIRKYLKAQKLYRDYSESIEPDYNDVIELDLSTVAPCLSGPKRPQDQVLLDNVKMDFLACLKNPVGFKGFGVKPDRIDTSVEFTYKGVQYSLNHGSVVIAAITSCTNTSNPSVMLGAALLAKKAVDYGLSVKPYIKTSLSPGSKIVLRYLQESNLLSYFEKLGFYAAGFGCMTCIGNSGELDDEICNEIKKEDLIIVSVLSGNRNFEGRVHPLTKANYLASPALCVAYALTGTINIDFNTQSIGLDKHGKQIYLSDIWPTNEEIDAVIAKHVLPKLFKECYSNIKLGNERWNALVVPKGLQYEWDEKSTYIHNPPFFKYTELTISPPKEIKDAYCLLYLGDSITTDHISPAGKISRESTAAKYLIERGIEPRDFNSYGSRRGNDEIMVRGTFANVRIINKFVTETGPYTLHIPSNQKLSIYDAAQKYLAEGHQLIVVAGSEYGTGSSRDWAAKGPYLLGIRAIIAKSFERIHRSNLIGMGILPLQFIHNENALSLNLSCKEKFSININNLHVSQILTVHTDTGKSFQVQCKIDTEVELAYYLNGGILQYVLRKLTQK